MALTDSFDVHLALKQRSTLYPLSTPISSLHLSFLQWPTGQFSAIKPTHAFARTNSRKFQIRVVGRLDTNTWTDLPKDLRYLSNLSLFKIKLHSWLIEFSGKSYRAPTPPTLSCASILYFCQASIFYQFNLVKQPT